MATHVPMTGRLLTRVWWPRLAAICSKAPSRRHRPPSAAICRRLRGRGRSSKWRADVPPAAGVPLIVAAAWIFAILASLTGWRALIDHHYLLEESGLPWPLAAAVFLAGWQVMIAAMMVPMSLPAISRALDGMPAAARPHRTLGAFFAAYAAVWTVFALVAFTADTDIHLLVDTWPWLATHAFVIGATTFALAGVFQFTPWKGSCLIACRNHNSVLGDDGASAAPAWWLGVRYGGASVGCCWALMLVMFGVGVGGLGWMTGLTGAMLAETASPAGTRARQSIGVALLLLAALWLAHPAWLVPATAS